MIDIMPMRCCSLVPPEFASENVFIWLWTVCGHWDRINGLSMFLVGFEPTSLRLVLDEYAAKLMLKCISLAGQGDIGAMREWRHAGRAHVCQQSRGFR